MLHNLVVESAAVNGNVSNPPPFSTSWVIGFNYGDIAQTYNLLLKNTSFVEFTAFQRTPLKPEVFLWLVAKHPPLVHHIKPLIYRHNLHLSQRMRQRGHKTPLVPLNAIAFYFLEPGIRYRISASHNVQMPIEVAHVGVHSSEKSFR